MKSFAELFKRYRLRAEFETSAAFGDALAEKGQYYDDSIFSHWQKGTRVPSNRKLLITIIEIFVEKDAIKTHEEADEFLAATGMGFLTEQEKELFHIKYVSEAPFQVPAEITHFTGREEVVKRVQKEILQRNIFLLHGPPGVGKTSLAIKLGHLLRNKFPDGVLWYKVDSSNIMDILLSIAHLFGEDISEIKDIEVRASIVRTLLTKKRLLLIFDNVSKQDKLYLLLPNTLSSCVIFTSRDNSLSLATSYTSVSLHTFTQEEVLSLFKKVFDKKYVEKYKKSILDVGEKVGNLPLAVNIVATHIKQFNLTPQTYLKQLEKEPIALQQLTYEDKSLLQAVSIGFHSLDKHAQNVFSSLGIFEGKDFSLEVVAFINKLSLQHTEHILRQLLDISFLEKSKTRRYRIHPLLKLFAREQIKDPSIYLSAANYYEQLLLFSQEKSSNKMLMYEIDNLVCIFKKCYDYGYWNEVITLWNPIEKFLSDVNEVKKLRQIAEKIDTTPIINNLQKALTISMTFLFVYWVILNVSMYQVSFWGSLYSLLYSLIPLIGGLVGILRSKSWGLFSSNIGKAIFFISAGLFSWATGNIIWAYYNFFQNVGIPYPSFADLGYFPSYLLWLCGIYYLSKVTGVEIALKQNPRKLFFLIIPFCIIVVSFYLQFFAAGQSVVSETPLSIFYDFYYPLLNILILSIVILISTLRVNFFGGKYKLSLIAILCGFAFQYLGGFIFSYTYSQNTYYNGNIADLGFTIGLFLITWGTLSFYLSTKKEHTYTIDKYYRI